ncbi:heme A synthase [Sulfurimicrobium lacus]|uniref:Heme A synthase n=1 Tax=Sulfurimicrobium lacus TaxID=2715678 RepID=A0A6F8VDS1_9PROT|nr:COX15/CtaA family protein [Sulfurimicrobium lacus]BCB27490.1 heme A synthase [Sulfurimicrobium lacus]
MSFPRLILFSILLAWGVVALGAYVRLSDAGLGCPDWPGCYGQLGAPATAQQRQAAQQAFPDRPVETHKAWKEMIHRYAAGSLGLLILGIFVRSWRERAVILRLSALLLALVAFQALLGRWTVTDLLRPAIVSAHLLGGMATLALLVWIGLEARIFGVARAGSSGLRLWALLGLAALAAQIALGGWTSSHYAGLVCGEGLSCRGSWDPAMDMAAAFSLSTRGAPSLDALTAIHWSHRIGALAVAAIVAGFATRLLRQAGMRRFAWVLLALLALQIALGLANVAWDLPLAAAVLHNAVAALLLALMVAVNWKLWRDS